MLKAESSTYAPTHMDCVLPFPPDGKMVGRQGAGV